MDERTGTPFIRYIVKRSLEEAWVEIQCPDRIYRLDYLEREEGEESP